MAIAAATARNRTAISESMDIRQPPRARGRIISGADRTWRKLCCVGNENSLTCHHREVDSVSQVSPVPQRFSRLFFDCFLSHARESSSRSFVALSPSRKISPCFDPHCRCCNCRHITGYEILRRIGPQISAPPCRGNDGYYFRPFRQPVRSGCLVEDASERADEPVRGYAGPASSSGPRARTYPAISPARRLFCWFATSVVG